MRIRHIVSLILMLRLVVWFNISECTVYATQSFLDHKILEIARQKSANVLDDGSPICYWSLNSEPIHSELANIFHIFLENIDWLLISDKTVLSVTTQSWLATTYCFPPQKWILLSLNLVWYILNELSLHWVTLELKESNPDVMSTML